MDALPVFMDALPVFMDALLVFVDALLVFMDALLVFNSADSPVRALRHVGVGATLVRCDDGCWCSAVPL